MDITVTCRDCKRRVPYDQTAPVTRYGGGNYRRAGRGYSGQTCVNCIEAVVFYLDIDRKRGRLDTSRGVSRYDGSGLIYGLASLIDAGHSDLDEARWQEKYPDNLHHPFEEFFPLLVDAITQVKVRREQAIAEWAERSPRA